ncbi:LysR family transcriptional regulator [Shumkonia mesophila]|uniref:LysR family transcriptional regulator n=1 Tax=Shumkonia mesophila TaxID=2838854 RepID=UPI0029348EEF|nr:LysR family transcriptional regulator [Shumkonia mesophila]
MDNLGSMSAFVEAAEARSFTAAGRQLGVSASAIGKAIARLEERVGVRLFHRSTRTITLTPEGALFLERCRRILGELEAAEMELAQIREAPRGRLRVSLPLVGVVMMPAVCAFMRAYPEVQLDLDFSDRLVDVIGEGFDAVVRAGEVADSRLMSRVLGEFHLMLVAAPAYLARRGVPKTPKELSAHACLHHRYATSGKFEPWPLRGGQGGTLPTAAIANTIEPLIHMAEQGLGIACLPDSAIRRQLADGTLRSVLDDHVRHAGLLRLLWPSSRHPSPKVRAFVDFMAENLFPPVAARRRRG